eukprot:scaffold2568_cov107-Skeletonema_dohrnii-CCMP3373.AAC.2
MTYERYRSPIRSRSPRRTDEEVAQPDPTPTPCRLVITHHGIGMKMISRYEDERAKKHGRCRSDLHEAHAHGHEHYLILRGMLRYAVKSK